ncbi:MAG: trypsin-like serine protease [Alphaproteobacteria bacterium]|nr:trypsin-like serine protease [Alphaproteobacteria bacterium]
MFYKKFLHVSFFALCTSTTLNAGFPLNPDNHEEMLQKGREFRAVGRIEYAPPHEGRSVALSYGSGTLIDSTDLGLPPQFHNRVVLTAAHVFGELLGSFKRGMPKQCNTNEARTHMNAYRFCVDVESDQTKPPVEQFFEIQNVFFSREYRPHNKQNKYAYDIAFAILKDPISDVSPLRIMKTKANESVGLNVQRVGYGVSGFLNSDAFFSDLVKRAGGMTITSACPSGTMLHYSLKFDPDGSSLHSLRPGHDSVTVTVDGEKRALEIDALSESTDSPELKQLLSHMTLEQLKSKLSEHAQEACLNAPNRTMILDEIAGVKLNHPLRISGGVSCPSFSCAGDSGGPALAYSDTGWGIVGITAHGSFKIEQRSFKEKLKEYVSHTPLSRLVPKRWLEPSPKPDVMTLISNAKRIGNGPALMQQLGVNGYAHWLHQKDGNFLERLWSRFRHKRALDGNTYPYKKIGNTLISSHIFAEAFAQKIVNPEKGFDPSSLNAPIYSFSALQKTHS